MSVIDRLSIIELYFYLDQIRLIQPNTQRGTSISLKHYLCLALDQNDWLANCW